MRWTLKTPPTDLPISVEYALVHCNLATSVADCEPVEGALVRGLIEAATNFIEQAENRQLITATWLASMDVAPTSRQVVELRGRLPLQTVAGIKYYDADGVEQTWDSAKYEVDAVDVDRPGRIRPIEGETWPTVGDKLNALSFELVCGYGDGPSSVPKSIQVGVAYLVSELYSVRERLSTMTINEIPNNALEVALDLMCWGNYPG